MLSDSVLIAFPFMLFPAEVLDGLVVEQTIGVNTTSNLNGSLYQRKHTDIDFIDTQHHVRSSAYEVGYATS